MSDHATLAAPAEAAEAGRDAEATALLRRLLDAARHKSADVARQLHPGWVERGLRRLGLDAALAATRPQPCAAPLAALYGLRWPGLDRFAPRAHRIALLPRDELRRVLAVVAVHGDRNRIRLTINSSVRASLVDRFGATAYGRMLESPPLRGPVAGAFTAAEVDAERLAAEGLVRLVAAGRWRDESLRDWARLAIAPAEPVARPVRPAAAEANEALERLPIYFPEHAWLFGSPTDRALSACPTA